MVGSVFNEGVKGLQGSLREMHKSANEIARANIREEPSETVTPEEPTTFEPLEETVESSQQRGIESPLVEMRRQEQIFNANAKVIQIASDALGSLIDVKS